MNRSSPPLFLMSELSVKLPADNQSFMRFFLSKTGFHLRLRGGGVGVVNLAHMTGYTVYPGVPQVPSDAWQAEPGSPREATTVRGFAKEVKGKSSTID